MSTTASTMATLFEALAVEQKGYIDRRLNDAIMDGKKPSYCGGAGSSRWDDPASQLERSDLRDMLRKGKYGRMELKELWPERKTAITETALGWATTGVVGFDRVPGVAGGARRQLRIRDLLPAATTQAAGVDFVQENVFTNAASPQTEGSSKAESAVTFTPASEKVKTIATWVPMSRQVWDDVAEVRNYVNDVLLYGLKLAEDIEILSGDNTGDHLNGLVTQATAYAGTYAAVNDTKLDTLNHYILELEVANFSPSAAVLNPIDFHTIQLIKNEEGGVANKGVYVASDPLGGYIQAPTLWGLPIVVSNSIASGYCLVGDFSRAKIYDRMPAVLEVSAEHSDYFTKNLLAIRCEERLALAVFRPDAFRYGAI